MLPGSYALQNIFCVPYSHTGLERYECDKIVIFFLRVEVS